MSGVGDSGSGAPAGRVDSRLKPDSGGGVHSIVSIISRLACGSVGDLH